MAEVAAPDRRVLHLQLHTLYGLGAPSPFMFLGQLLQRSRIGVAAGEDVFFIGAIRSGDKGCTVSGSIETWSAKAAWSATHAG